LPGHAGVRADGENGIKLVGRSSSITARAASHCWPEEPTRWSNCVRGAPAKPIARHDRELYDELTAMSQNRWPSRNGDFGAVNDCFVLHTS